MESKYVYFFIHVMCKAYIPRSGKDESVEVGGKGWHADSAMQEKSFALHTTFSSLHPTEFLRNSGPGSLYRQ